MTGWIQLPDFDPFFSNDYQFGGKARVADVEVVNSGVWRHAIVKYLRASALRSGLGRLLQL